jgi:TatD DNase family protein
MENIQGIFDSHAHYDDPAFDPDREEVLASLAGSGVSAVMNIGADLESSRMVAELARTHDFIWAAVGVHPHGAADLPEDWLRQLEELAALPRVRAIGEIGFDYHYDGDWKEAQRRVFEEQLQLAARLGLPVVIHDRDAHGDTMELLRQYRPAGVVHCYSGSAEMAKEILSLGMYIGFTGVVTFKNARRALEAAAVVPLDRLLVETDCPYMAPEPFRGRRCDSSMLPYTIGKLAEVKGISPQELAHAAAENARHLFLRP